MRDGTVKAGDIVKVRLQGVSGWPSARVRRVYAARRRASVVVIAIAAGYHVRRGDTVMVDISDCTPQQEP